ncbi:fused MFS/spermidine synthase [candidate division KSB1 bacterium]|nr:fused MFS/spermidine synthase [candidate division KSB1 bacterium]
MKNFFLYVIVFIGGAAVLAIEILGTRILGPFYGVSLFLWSALITVTLIALSVGYAIGGRWADKGAKMSRLAYMMFGAGVWTLFIPWIKQPVLVFTEPFGLRFAVLIAAFILFVPPLTHLGMVSPYAIRLRASSLEVVGRTAGDLYAISTLGGVLSALLTGFILIPNIGVSRLTLAIGTILLLTASTGLVLELRSKTQKLATSTVTVLAAIGTIFIPFEKPRPDHGLLAIEQSPYAEIRVLDVNERRHLLIDGGTHTIVDPETWESYFPYTAVVDLTREFFERPGDVLLIGLGGGTLVKNFAHEGWKVEAVEIDPVVIEVACKYFGLKESEGTIYSMDGRQFLITHDRKYDIIIMDAFGSSSIPFHLVTQESFGLVASRLKPDGIFAINIEAHGWDDLIVRSFTATLKRHFREVLALPAYEPAHLLGNMIILASHRQLQLQYDIQQHPLPPPGYRFELSYRRDFAWRNRFVPDTRNAPVLSDDLNPVELWSEKINLVARKGLHSYFEESGLSW